MHNLWLPIHFRLPNNAWSRPPYRPLKTRQVAAETRAISRHIVEKEVEMNVLKLLKQEDVSQFDMGSHQVSVVAVTDESKDALVEIAMSMYLGESCKYCGKKYETLADLETTVFAGYHEHGRLACNSCWYANNAG